MPSAVELAYQVGEMWPDLSPSEQLLMSIEMHELKIQHYPFHRRVSGCLTNCRGLWVIGVNLRHSETRQRFTIAHELGHFLAKHPPMICLDGVDWAQERFANRFASSLLMPVRIVRPILSKGGTAEDIARTCLVSVEAATRRILELDKAQRWQ